MRFGVHSGPVTAGVLRGEKSRFQLFGDSMNFAATMETKGTPNKVHLSKETADLLVEGGKSAWIEKRDDRVTVKGKGEVETFWLKSHLGKGRRANTESDALSETGRSSVSGTGRSDGSSSHDDPEVVTASGGFEKAKRNGSRKRRSSIGAVESLEKLDRLVSYNAEVMITLLKKIIARRSAVHDDFKELGNSTGGRIALDEMREVIQMPAYNDEAVIKMASDSSVEIPEQVRTEMRGFLHRIAETYLDNPFHNFMHASHVAMSANKLLKRIVMPEEVDYRSNSNQSKVQKVLGIARDLHEHTLGISSDPVTQFAVVFAALIHDAGHTGVPNFILAQEEPETAEKYKNKSIAEQRSIDIAWDILMEDGFENLRRCMFLTAAELKHFRQLIVNCVMATGKHPKCAELNKLLYQISTVFRRYFRQGTLCSP